MTNLWTWSRTAASNATADGSLWPENQLPSTVNNSARDNMASVARHRDDQSGMLVTAGTSNAYTLTSATTGLTLVDGLTIAFRADRANSGAATLAVDSAAAKNIKKLGGTALASGDIVEGAIYRVTYYQSADEWRLLSSVPPAVAASAVAFTPAGSIAATNTQAAIEELGTEKAAASHAHVMADITDLSLGGPASSVSFTPAGNIEATTVQAALQELDTEKAIAANFATTSSPQFAGINVGHETDTTITRVSAGAIAVEGVGVALNSTSLAHTAGTVELGHDTDTTLARSAAGIVTVEGTALLKAGRQTIWIPAGAMTPRTTNGAASNSAEMSTNKNIFKTLDFDTTTQEFAQFEIFFPKSWGLGTVTFEPVWSHASTTTNYGVVFGLAGVARSNDDAGDAAFGTAVTSSDTGGTTNDIYIGPESSAITIAGTPAAGDTVQFQINRTVADGGDTMAIDARLHGIRLFFTTNAATDA
jgi:hypothetical protein